MPARALTYVLQFSLLLSFFTTPFSVAEAETWVGNLFVNNNWSNALNWLNEDGPDNSFDDDLFFRDSIYTTPTVDRDYKLNSLNFTLGAVIGVPPAAYTIGGSGLLTFGGSSPSIGTQWPANQTINAPIALDDDIGVLEELQVRNTGDVLGIPAGRITLGGDINTKNRNLQIRSGASGAVINGAISGAGELLKEGSGVLTLTARNTYTGHTVIDDGTLLLQGNGRLPDHSTVYVDSDGVLDLGGKTDAIFGLNDAHTGSGSGTVRLFGGGDLVIGNFDLGGRGDFSGTIIGDGTVTKRGPLSQTLSGVSSHTGATTITQGTLTVNGTLGSTSRIDVQMEGTLRGNGSLNGPVTVESGGLVNPGHFVGSLAVESVVFESGATLEIDIRPIMQQLDVLEVAGSASLAGALEVTLINSEMLMPTDAFTILTSTALSGAFDNVADGARLDVAGGEGSFLVNYDGLSDAVVLSDFVAALTADFDGDGDVDGADLANPTDGWEARFGNDLDGSNFLAWQREFGSGLRSTSASTPVPEPSGILLLLGLAAVGMLFRTA